MATVATSFFLVYLVKALDRDSIISARRMFGLTMASSLLWAAPTIAGSLYSWARHSNQPSLNEFVLGSFLAWSLEFVVINGAFMASTAKSILAGAIQPLAGLLVVSAFIRWSTSTDFAALLGIVVLCLTVAFLLKFKGFKTKGTGISSLQTFQSFLKSWVSHRPADLEGYFSMYAREQPVTTKILLAGSSGQVAMVLPGVHPGPFFPVGSYNISELIFRELRKKGITSIVLHGTGGHERNLPTNELAQRYAASVAEAAKTPAAQVEKMRGPHRLQLGKTIVTTLGFGSQVVAFLSKAPYNTDDLEPGVFDEALSVATKLGVELTLVDAHNSIGGEDCEQPKLDWSRVIAENRALPEEDFEIGVANSSELNFPHGSDISEGGITALVFKKAESTSVLIASDSNNAVTGLRNTLALALEKEGVELIELCTSDTHDSAARHMTHRGYHALGEDSDRETLVATIQKLEKAAESKLTQGRIATVASEQTLPLIGDNSINDFAALTKEAIDFTKVYAAAAMTLALVICAAALFV